MDLVGPKVGFVKDPAFYAAWAQAHRKCHACGIPTSKAKSMRWPGLSTHHIIKPGRSDEACNLLRLCQRDHDLAEGRSIRVNGNLLPKLSIGICLSLKKECSPGEWDPERLAWLFGKSLPDLEPIPSFLLLERAQWK